MLQSSQLVSQKETTIDYSHTKIIQVKTESIKHRKTEIVSVRVRDDFLSGEARALPTEIWNLILLFSTADKISSKYLLVCKQFYHFYLPFLYKRPVLDASNFPLFVETVGKVGSKIGTLVHHLDLSTIVQSGKNSSLSKVLRRCAPNLETFIAPQASFGYAPMMSLRSCKQLKVLDLSLVINTVNLNELFRAVPNFNSLTHLKFPKSSNDIDMKLMPENPTRLPSSLWFLKMSGGITDDFVMESYFPQTIKRLELSHCSSLNDYAIYKMLKDLGKNLTHLTVQYPMSCLEDNSMDHLFTYCPNLLFLQLNVDYCTSNLFSDDFLPLLPETPRPLKTLWLESSGKLGQHAKIDPDDLTIAIMEERLPCLKNVRVTVKLGWDFKSDDVSYLINLLEETGGGLYLGY